METTAVGLSPTTQRDSSRSVKGLESEDFFKLMITELQQQDPLEPTKTADMIGQVSRIRSIEQTETMNQTLKQMADSQRTAGAGDLLNKFVIAESGGEGGGATTRVSGVVTGVRFADDGTMLLDLDSGQTIRAQDVKQIAGAAVAIDETEAATTGETVGKGDAASAKDPLAAAAARLARWKPFGFLTPAK